MKSAAARVAACACALGMFAASAQDRPIARASATEVLLDVAVTDKHGKPVRNLKASDLEVFEDGVRQPVTSFKFLSAAEARQVTTRADAPPVAAGSRALRSVNLVCVVFHNLDPVARLRAAEVAREFLK